MTSKTLEVGGNCRVTMNDSFWLTLQGEDGHTATTWLSIDEALNIAKMLETFAAMQELPDTVAP